MEKGKQFSVAVKMLATLLDHLSCEETGQVLMLASELQSRHLKNSHGATDESLAEIKVEAKEVADAFVKKGGIGDQSDAVTNALSRLFGESAMSRLSRAFADKDETETSGH